MNRPLAENNTDAAAISKGSSQHGHKKVNSAYLQDRMCLSLRIQCTFFSFTGLSAAPAEGECTHLAFLCHIWTDSCRYNGREDKNNCGLLSDRSWLQQFCILFMHECEKISPTSRFTAGNTRTPAWQSWWEVKRLVTRRCREAMQRNYPGN
ncbi:uncharacterized protein LALA0_S08e00210g [Lachancea lanzarotensis]|uniref:LALA0S08e00210g1_1 n=1 Tax=Lachancea lanzarotensis TaxID=1245769 RepID=A0A0C7N9X3_9SACH|nr:uncharacterized protein LALA0_S08e00210g [Lachancea lanzarotensis]CEP63341.1 LALA0S08e00210g1_1 [Lachancea lanzarotensis]